MAISKSDYRVVTPLGTRATPVTYWRYAGVDRFVKLPLGAPGEIKNGVVVKLEGYSNAAQRKQAKDNGYAPDYDFEFLIVDWVEPVREERAATVAEKKQLLGTFDQYKDFTEKQWKDLPYELTVDKEPIIHNDYQTFMQNYGGENEVATVYEIMKGHKYSRDFFEGSVDV